MSAPHALLVDGNNVAHRAWYVAKGDPVRAREVLGSLLRAALAATGATHAAIAFDDDTCWRTRLLPTYKANRRVKDPALRDYLDDLADLWQIDGIATVHAPDHEADDVLATLATQAGALDWRVTVYTADQDALALVTGTCWVLRPDGVVMDVPAVERKLGVPPRLVQDYKALAGDSGDNVPGVPGVGPVKARVLLRAHGSFDSAVLALKPRDVRGVSVGEGVRLGILSYQVVGLRRSAPVMWDVTDTKLEVSGA